MRARTHPYVTPPDLSLALWMKLLTTPACLPACPPASLVCLPACLAGWLPACLPRSCASSLVCLLAADVLGEVQRALWELTQVPPTKRHLFSSSSELGTAPGSGGPTPLVVSSAATDRARAGGVMDGGGVLYF